MHRERFPLFVSRPEYIPEIKARLDLLLSDLTNQHVRFDKAQKAMEVLQMEKCWLGSWGQPLTYDLVIMDKDVDKNWGQVR